MSELWTPPAFARTATNSRDQEVFGALQRGRTMGPAEDPAVAEMAKNRRINGMRARAMAKTGIQSGGHSDVTLATGRPMDPMFYWQTNNLPYDVNKPGELEKIRAYCSDPSSLVWMGDYTFKPIGEVQPGDVVIGWEDAANGKRTRLVRSTVLAVQERLAPETIRMTTESGRTWTGTPDHKFANPYWSPNNTGVNKARQWVNPTVGTMLRHVIDPTEPLTDSKQREAAAYLGGLYDGEGSGTMIAQCPIYNPAVYARIEYELGFLGLPAARNKQGIRIAGNGRGTRQDFVNFLNWTTPTRRVSQQIDQTLLTARFGTRDRVTSVEPLGPGRVVSMQTSTGNYVVQGFASSNCRLIYLTHPIIASAIDVFSKYPLTGMEFACKDEQLTDFYSTLFLDQLNYEEFLIDLLREYWTVGEAWPLGSFNEMLGVWEDDELINPDDVDVIRSPFLKEPRFQMRLPESIRRIIDTRSPKWEFEALMRSYPELKNFVGDQARMPVSNVLLKQISFKADTFHPRGIPILMRGFRAIMQEEMLNAAQDAVASRLYTPLILAKLGASATDLGTQNPWIPSESDISAFEEALDIALAADFRVLTHHFAVDMESVFGRENMPQMDADFDRLIDRQLQVFGMSKTMLTGADANETYAADAINRDLVSQLLTTAQRKVKKFTRDRMLVVAEAQGHYDYEERGGKRYPIMEEVLEVDEETGKQRIVEQPKLLVPDLHIKAMTMKDETDQRQFYEALRATGVPISMKSRMINVPLDLKDEIDRVRQEQIDLAVEAQETRKQTFLALSTKGLPVPEDLEKDFRPKAHGAGGAADEDPADKAKAVNPKAPAPAPGVDPSAAQVLPALGNLDPNDAALVPTPADVAAAERTQPGGPPPTAPGGGQPGAGAPQAQVIPMSRQKSRPPESDEMRASMPKPASLLATNDDGQKVAEVLNPAEYDEDGKETKAAAWREVVVEKEGANSILTGPRHVGQRREAAKKMRNADGSLKPLEDSA